MLSRWPIRSKLLLGLALLLGTMMILSFSSFKGVYSYRELVRGVSRRAAELPLSIELARRISDLRITVAEVSHAQKFPIPATTPEFDRQIQKQDFRQGLAEIKDTVDRYRAELARNEQALPTALQISVGRREWDALHRIDHVIHRIERLEEVGMWLIDEIGLEEIGDEIDALYDLSAELPSFLQDRMFTFSDTVRLKYRTWIVITWLTSFSAMVLLGVFGFMAYTWVFRPLRSLLRGSRRVAAGDFDHRILLTSQDEMAELAGAMNDMTQRFQEIRDDLDDQVRQRSTEVIRSEQMASVGFLAAGVAHEINNPLASIALCAESLEDRVRDIIHTDDELPDCQNNEEVTILRNYLRMIQDEAFRCKQITEQLLDFSRLSDVEKHRTDLGALVHDVVEMVKHLGNHKEKQIRVQADDYVAASCNAQEMKQVVLNLITNALDSIDAGGTVTVEIRQARDKATLKVIDDGCGMTEEVRKHLFEPFFTRRRDGQGTGLGMSITYRIVTDHGGTICAKSDGPGRGATIEVGLPLGDQDYRERYHQQAA